LPYCSYEYYPKLASIKKVPLVFIRRIPADLRSHYRSDRLCLSLRPKFE